MTGELAEQDELGAAQERERGETGGREEHASDRDRS
jgi:hypothetical protein